MAIRFTYFGFEYEILEDKKNEVALIDASNAQGKTFIPKEVEYEGQKYAVTQITGKDVSYSYLQQQEDRRRKPILVNASRYRGAFQIKKHNGESKAWKKNNNQFEVVIPNSVTSIGARVFGYCCGLTSVTIPNSVTSIGALAFDNCSGLTSVTIPNSVTNIGNSAFAESGLISIEIPNSITSIGFQTFCCCDGLKSITIPNSVTSIGERAFGACSGLTSITIPHSVTSIGEQAFSSYDFEGDMYLETVTIENEEGAVLIDPTAFPRHTKLNYVGKPKTEPKKEETKPEPKKEEPKPDPAKPTSASSTDGKMTVAQLAAEFKAQFGSVLRIYNGRSKADDSLSLQEVGLTGNLALPFDGNQKVGDLIAQMGQIGLKVKVYTCDEWVACLDGLTLTQTGQVKKCAVKADMEKML